jgi:ubiquinone/menaquinone biosynthesis C-methylase UbiE
VVQEPVFQALLDALRPLRGDELIELGCNIGYVLDAASRDKPLASAVGFDISLPALQLAARTLPQAWFVKGTGFALPFGRACCDIVFCRAYLVNIPRDGAEVALAEAWRITRHYLVVCEPMLDDPSFGSSAAFSRHDGFYFHLYDEMLRRRPNAHIVTRQRIETATGYQRPFGHELGEYLWVVQRIG